MRARDQQQSGRGGGGQAGQRGEEARIKREELMRGKKGDEGAASWNIHTSRKQGYKQVIETGVARQGEEEEEEEEEDSSSSSRRSTGRTGRRKK
ncbi:hypothetical protein O3P69_004152 [Scylla paramamosain]|uniref:Uncharacterized protein n=1 Tax=Scylla paramamosain TaxID=85552 RepID=A0AAW0UIR4_SCYPA